MLSNILWLLPGLVLLALNVWAAVSISSIAQDTALTDQEPVVLSLAAQGPSNGRTARELDLSEKTVCNLLSSVHAKLDVDMTEDVNPHVAVVNRARENPLPSS